MVVTFKFLRTLSINPTAGIHKLPVMKFDGKKPTIHPSCYIDPTAVIIGNVTIGEDCSVWPNAVIRGDQNRIVIGARTSVQDNCVIHVTSESPVTVAGQVVIGHGAILHACSIGKNVLVGINAVVLNGVKVGDRVIIVAGAMVTENTEIPSSSLVMGVPAKVAKTLSPAHVERIRAGVDSYVRLGRRYREASGRSV